MQEPFADILKKYWGYDSFRPGQEEIIRAAYEGYDVLALMPTGGGKSVCFQVPALAREGLTLVISPLIALMTDQVERLQQMGIPALCVHSGMDRAAIDRTLDNAIYGDYKFLYLSPERLQSALFAQRMARMPISLIVVDEAHCISQWGYDFRPAYLEIAACRQQLPGVNLLALTATATEAVAEDIMQKLAFTARHKRFATSFARPNLSYIVRETQDKQGQLCAIIKGVGGSGLVYVRERKRCVELAQMLQAQGIAADFYHAGLSPELRAAKQEAWKSGRLPVMVATNAFGMGIDKANVRYVCHFDVPESPEAYFQEAGRAGRDGQKAYAVLLYHPADKLRLEQIYRLTFPSTDYILDIYQKVYAYHNIAYGNGREAAFDFSLYDFAAAFKIQASAAYYALDCLRMEGYLTLTDELDNPTRVMITVDRDTLYKIQIRDPLLDAFLKTLLRAYEGLFSTLVPIDEDYLAKVGKDAPANISAMLLQLSRLGVLTYIPRKRSPKIFFHQERLRPGNVHISPQNYGLRKEAFRQRLDAMFHYIEAPLCRSQSLLAYFGQKESAPCGHCDVCISQKQADKASRSDEYIRRRIKERLLQGPCALKDMELLFESTPQRVGALLREMVLRHELSLVNDTLSLPLQ